MKVRVHAIQYFSSRSKALLVALTFAIGFSTTGCGSSAINLFPKSQDVQLGQQMAAKIAADPAHYPVLNNPSLTAYLQSIENRIVQSPNVTNKDFDYKITIINDPNTVNAFTIPGGHIYVYTGLLRFIDDEATLAGVLAHETTHADHRHSTALMTKQYGLQILAGVALGNNAGLLGQIVAGLGTQLSVLKFSRDDETDADKNSFQDLLQLPGRPWWPAGAERFLQKAVATQPNQPAKFQQFFQDHPLDQTRINNFNTWLKQSGVGAATASQLNASGYARYKQMVP